MVARPSFMDDQSLDVNLLLGLQIRLTKWSQNLFIVQVSGQRESVAVMCCVTP